MDAAEAATVPMTTIDTHVRPRASRLTRRRDVRWDGDAQVSCPVMRWSPRGSARARPASRCSAGSTR